MQRQEKKRRDENWMFIKQAVFYDCLFEFLIWNFNYPARIVDWNRMLCNINSW